MVERLHILHAGHIAMPQRWIRTGGSDELEVIPVLCFLAVCSDRLILVDTGCSPVVVEDPAKAWGRLARLYHPQVSAEEVIDAQIQAAGFDVGDVTDVVLTHLHMDHAGGLCRLGHHPRIWVQRAEHRWGGCPDPHGSGGYYRNEFDLPGADLRLLDGDAPIADGVQVVLTDGHTPGHQSVLIQLASGLQCVVGDAAYNRVLLERRSLPPVATDVGRYMASLTRLRTLESYFGATLLFSHDAEQAAKLPSANAPIC